MSEGVLTQRGLCGFNIKQPVAQDHFVAFFGINLLFFIY